MIQKLQPSQQKFESKRKTKFSYIASRNAAVDYYTGMYGLGSSIDDVRKFYVSKCFTTLPHFSPKNCCNKISHLFP